MPAAIVPRKRNWNAPELAREQIRILIAEGEEKEPPLSGSGARPGGAATASRLEAAVGIDACSKEEATKRKKFVARLRHDRTRHVMNGEGG